MVQKEVVKKTYNQLPVVDPDLEQRERGGEGAEERLFFLLQFPFFVTQNKGGPVPPGPSLLRHWLQLVLSLNGTACIEHTANFHTAQLIRFSKFTKHNAIESDFFFSFLLKVLPLA